MIKTIRVLAFILISAYSYIFIHIYINWASKVFFYMGFTYNYNINKSLFSFVCIFICFVLLPLSIKKYSDYFVWVIYIVIYIPTLLCISMQEEERINSFALMLSITISFITINLIPSIIILKEKKVTKINKRFLFYFMIIYLTSVLYYLYVYWNHLKFSYIDEIYVQRAEFSALKTGAGIIALYLTGWLSTALNPYLICIGLFDRSRIWAFGVGIAGQIIVYMAFAGKMMLAMVLVMIYIRFLIYRYSSISVIGILFSSVILITIPLVILNITGYLPYGVYMEIVSLVYMRTLGIQGVLTGIYAGFFSSNPYTFWSHANIINIIIEYPYREPLGFVVGNLISGGSNFNANANFWATDGIAAFGYFGVIIIGFIIGFLLVLANRIVGRAKLNFATVITIPFIMSLGNSSLFTSLVTGGGILVFLMISRGAPVLTEFSK